MALPCHMRPVPDRPAGTRLVVLSRGESPIRPDPTSSGGSTKSPAKSRFSDPRVGASHRASGSDHPGRACAISNGIAGRAHAPVSTQFSAATGTGSVTGRVNASTSAFSHDDMNPGYRGAGHTHDGSAWRRRSDSRPLRGHDEPGICLLALRLWPAVRCAQGHGCAALRPTGSGQSPNNVRCAHRRTAPPGPCTPRP